MYKHHPLNRGRRSTGAISGMIIGGALANDMAESKNKALATVLGAFVGGVIGQNIGAQLDERDRLLAGEAYNTALEFNPTDKATKCVIKRKNLIFFFYKNDIVENLLKKFS